MLRAQCGRQLGRRLYAILQWNDERLGPDHGPYGLCRLRHLPGFHADQNNVGFTNLRRVISGQGRPKRCLSRGAFNAKTMLTNRA